LVFDSDDYQTHVDDLALLLENKKWTDYFEFRPTYELVAKWIFDTLRPDLPGLAYVALENKTIGVTTKYQLVDKN